MVRHYALQPKASIRPYLLKELSQRAGRLCGHVDLYTSKPCGFSVRAPFQGLGRYLDLGVELSQRVHKDCIQIHVATRADSSLREVFNRYGNLRIKGIVSDHRSTALVVTSLSNGI